jgi:hypothetical protein
MIRQEHSVHAAATQGVIQKKSQVAFMYELLAV